MKDGRDNHSYHLPLRSDFLSRPPETSRIYSMTSYLFAIVVTLSLLFSKAYSADGDDPEDLSFLKKGAAIGDS
jgi:hypothetical protein